MDNEYKVWTTLLTVITVICLSIIFTIGGCCMHRNTLVSKMVENGASPIEAQMAVRESEMRQIDMLLAIKALCNTNKQKREIE